jgi:hypothetical protein
MSISQAKLKGNLGAIADYFLEVDADLGDYYLADDGEPEAAPPRALGTLAERLGLTGEVSADQLLRLLDGRHPITGRRILEYRKDRVAGVDQTASAPKSVSVVWAVGRPRGAPGGRASAGHRGDHARRLHAAALPARAGPR